MPFLKYFVFVGCSLLALLFAVDHYLPSSSARSAAADVDRSIIRIRSTIPPPDRVVYDTAHPPARQVAALADTGPESGGPDRSFAMMADAPVQRSAETARVVERHRTHLVRRRIRRATEPRMASSDHAPDLFAGW